MSSKFKAQSSKSLVPVTSEECLAIVATAALIGCAFLVAGLLMLMLTGCAGTVMPKTAAAKQASWDGTNQNSGFVGFAPDGRGIITAHARDRYNGLIQSYGIKFNPPLQVDAGLTSTSSNVWLIDQQHLQDFIEMQRWKRQAP